MLLILFSIMCVGLDFVTDASNKTRNCLNDVWYMTLTLLISTIKKYKILPLVATSLYSSLAAFIFISVSAAV